MHPGRTADAVRLHPALARGDQRRRAEGDGGDAARGVPRGHLPDRAYEDTPLPIACGQTISQPTVVGLMTQALEVTQRCKVLEVGTGSGYQAAILARLARRVYTVERHRRLARRTRELFLSLGLHNITVVHGDGSLGLPEQAPFDRIIVTAAAEDPPQVLLDQLRQGGIMVLPVGQSNAVQTLIRIVKTEDGLGIHRPRRGAVRAPCRRGGTGRIGLGRHALDMGRGQDGRGTARRDAAVWRRPARCCSLGPSRLPLRRPATTRSAATRPSGSGGAGPGGGEPAARLPRRHHLRHLPGGGRPRRRHARDASRAGSARRPTDARARATRCPRTTSCAPGEVLLLPDGVARPRRRARAGDGRRASRSAGRPRAPRRRSRAARRRTIRSATARPSR